MKDYYNILAVDYNATEEEIKSAYIMLAKMYHPDTTKFNQSIAQKKTAEINEAYEILMDPFRRKEYDRLRAKEGKETTETGEYAYWLELGRKEKHALQKLDYLHKARSIARDIGQPTKDIDREILSVLKLAADKATGSDKIFRLREAASFANEAGFNGDKNMLKLRIFLIEALSLKDKAKLVGLVALVCVIAAMAFRFFRTETPSAVDVAMDKAAMKQAEQYPGGVPGEPEKQVVDLSALQHELIERDLVVIGSEIFDKTGNRMTKDDVHPYLEFLGRYSKYVETGEADLAYMSIVEPVRKRIAAEDWKKTYKSFGTSFKAVKIYPVNDMVYIYGTVLKSGVTIPTTFVMADTGKEICLTDILSGNNMTSELAPLMKAQSETKADDITEKK